MTACRGSHRIQGPPGNGVYDIEAYGPDPSLVTQDAFVKIRCKLCKLQVGWPCNESNRKA